MQVQIHRINAMTKFYPSKINVISTQLLCLHSMAKILSDVVMYNDDKKFSTQIKTSTSVIIEMKFK